MASIQNDLASDVGQAFDRPINVSVIEKAGKFSFLQQLGHDGQLAHAKETFHGLGDFQQQIITYSASNPFMLSGPMAAIKALAPLNLTVAKQLSLSKTLGKVGPSFKQMVGFDQVFAVSPDELKTKGSGAIVGKL